MGKQGKQLVNIRLDRGLWHKVKVQSAIEGKTITDWLTEVLEKKVGGK